MSRALRRHHRARLKKARKNYWSANIGMGEYRRPLSPRLLGMVLATPHPCSWHCCGNRRLSEGPTMQERRFTPAIQSDD